MGPNLVLQTAVLPLRVLPDDHDINVFMTSLDSWERLAVHHISEKVQAGAVYMQRVEREKTTGGQLGDKHRGQAQFVMFRILLFVLLPEDVIPGLDRRRHGVFGFYVTYQGRSKGHIQLNHLDLLHFYLVKLNTLLLCL